VKGPAKYATPLDFPKRVSFQELELFSSSDARRINVESTTCSTEFVVVATVFRDMLKRNHDNDFGDMTSHS